MGNAPSLRNIKAEQAGKFRRRRPCNRILPGAVGGQEPAVAVKSKISVHHGGNSDAADFFKLQAVLILYAVSKLLIAVPEAVPDIVQGIGPYSVFIRACPVMAAGSNQIKVPG